MKFTRLRLSGFKSFVEPTELFIEPGLTAIVGPNGCGKSNLFDALRWVMGETRPTSIRGTEMDDVIFAGSAARPARNTAEVILFVDNTDRSASAPYNEYDTIEISRRIERETGSVYRINGRDVRQRDVQIFFADASSGAGSTAFVRQGQIGMLVSQKPLARRAILEEAAGIGGLHQRRHEAELRLRAAETNMARLDDVIREVEGQLQNLKRQARQASRYRNLSGHIRRAEALALYLRWSAAQSQLETAKEDLAKVSATVADCTARASEASTMQANAAAKLPPLRKTEAERGAALHRLIVEREALDAEETRARDAAQRIRQLIVQAGQDIARERELQTDAETALSKLKDETETLRGESSREQQELAAAEKRAADLGSALIEKERRLEALNAELAEWHARKNSLQQSRELAEALAKSSAAQLAEAERRLKEALSGASAAPDVRAAEADTERARNDAKAARDAHAAARAKFEAAQKAANDLRTPLEELEHEVQRLSAEAKALADLLSPEGQTLWPPLVDAVTVQPGYEAALAATLGDDLQAPLDEAAPHHWRDLGKFDAPTALPAGVQPLSQFVRGPAALSRRLAMTGVVFPDQGAGLQNQLKPGQRLVSARGDLWRWDGYAASADAPSPAAARLAQRNRLAALESEMAVAKQKRATAFERYSAAKRDEEAAHTAVREAEKNALLAEQALIGAQDTTTKSARAAAERASQLASLEAEVRRLAETRDTALRSGKEAEKSLSSLADENALANAVAKARGEVAEIRSENATALGALESLKRAGEMRVQRLAAINEDETRWQARLEAAVQQIAELNRRSEDMTQELLALETVPQAIAGKRNALLDAIGNAEAARDQAADARAQAESELSEADKHAKTADAALSGAREERARAQALLESAEARIEELKTRIRDELDASPGELAEQAEIKESQELPPLDLAEKRVEKLKQEREQLGGVNLRAEEEANEHEQRLQTLTNDRNDLDGAIQRLRRGIQSLNREGRERLLESFEKVNANFQLLFTKLFIGGEAKLTLTESEDPLEAGLEIFARPPGKRLQSLSLLSGGEQSLTALALIFAVFLVNPAPICVLDEAEAALDDTNVERFCNMLDEMTRLTDTRFIVITHHALTMSRVHRLFGVTMAERGVSQLVSVSLAEAARVAADVAAAE